jgi:hypothetical protein
MEQEEQLRIEYSEEEKEYVAAKHARLTVIERQYQEPRTEFDGMTYAQYYESNEKGANTYIEPKKDKYDNNFQSGTVRSKLFAILSAISNLNLSPDISAFNDDNNEIESLGNSIENIIYKTEELEGDEEKKILRQYELLKQGTVFVEEVWKTKNIVKKNLKGKFNGSLAVEWSETIKKSLPQPERNILSGLGVYLGDIRQYFITNQPDLFTVEVMPYENAKAIYGKWDRWKYVPKNIVRNPITDGKQNTQYGWHITEVDDGQVEIIKYQNKGSNEFCVFINGILMTPINLPFLWGWDDYNIVQQNLEPITMTFAYGKSLVARIKGNVAIYDHLLRLAVEKTEKSFNPSRANLSGRLLSSKMFKAGNVVNGIRPEQVPIFDQNTSNNGMTNAEMMLINKLQETNDFNSVSPNFQGQQKSGDTTATESVLAQRQAEASIGVITNMCGLLEEKLAWLRLYNILQNWFDPTGTVVDEARGEIVNKYRSIARTAPIQDRGIGVNIVRADDKSYTSDDVLRMEKDYEKQSGKPTKITIIDPEWIKTAKIIWQITIVPKQKKNSDLSKVMFKEFMANLMLLQPVIGIGWDYAAEELATVWEKDKSKLFPKGSTQPPMQPTQGANGGATVAPVENGSMAGVPDLNGTTNMKV